MLAFDWLSWFPCTWTARDHHRLLLQWRCMTIWPLTWLVQLWHIMIWPLTWLVQLWKVPRKTPLLAYINQEFVAIKPNCLDGIPVAFDCLSLAEGLGWRTAGSPLFGTPRLCWGKFHCLSLSAGRPPQNSSWAISNPKRWCCESAALNMSANVENSAVATGLKEVSFHSKHKER